jgi:hypothetical protein
MHRSKPLSPVKLTRITARTPVAAHDANENLYVKWTIHESSRNICIIEGFQ